MNRERERCGSALDDGISADEGPTVIADGVVISTDG